MTERLGGLNSIVLYFHIKRYHCIFRGLVMLISNNDDNNSKNEKFKVLWELWKWDTKVECKPNWIAQKVIKKS